MKEQLRISVKKFRSSMSTALIEVGLKKESEMILNEREYVRNSLRKKDFDSVYACIDAVKTPTDIANAEKLVNNFNKVYGEHVSGQYIPAAESYIFNIAVQLKYTEICEGIYCPWTDEEMSAGMANIRPLNSLTVNELLVDMKKGIQMSDSIKKAYANKVSFVVETVC